MGQVIYVDFQSRERQLQTVTKFRELWPVVSSLDEPEVGMRVVDNDLGRLPNGR